MPAGVALLDDTAAVVHLNPEAERIVRRGDGLNVFKGRLVAARGGHPFQAALAQVHGASFALSRSSGLGDYLIVVTPVRANDQRIGGRRVAKLVFITDPEMRPAAREDVLRQLWRLTAAEAGVAAALLDGLAPKEIAARHAVSEATVRTQMRMIFAKTGTAKQVDLVRLLASAAGLYRPPNLKAAE